jgi:N-acetylmuramic acid 6-phosphate etherase
MNQQPTSPTPGGDDPPDRGHIDTEQRHDGTRMLDQCSVRECVLLINDADRQIADAVRASTDSITAFIEDLVPRMRGGGRLIYIGAGTSGRLGVLDAAECPPTFQTDPGQVIGIIAGGDPALRRSSEHREDDPRGVAPDFDRIGLTTEDMVLGIAAGGTTPYVLGGLRLAHERGAATGLLTCSTIETPPGVDHLIVVATGPEVITGSTRMKAGTATKLVLNTITTTTMVQLGKVYENLMVDLRATNDKLRDRAARIVSELTDLDRTAALSLLDAAGGHVKTALVMHGNAVTCEVARERLERAEGRLRDALRS